MTGVEAIKAVLSQSQESLTAQEIYALIRQRDLYRFAAKNPSHIVLTALRRHCQGLDFPTSSPIKHFRIGPPRRGKTTYLLADATPHISQEPRDAGDREKLPEEVILAAYHAHRESVKTVLLEKILANDPSFFEHLVLKLLLSMGYGYSLESGTVVGGPYDQGIDGIIYEDELRFSQILFQAKHYAANHVVRAKELREFAGSILASDSGVTRGVFITTSHFDKNALDYARKVGAKQNVELKLLDGRQLADLMLQHKVGVAVADTFFTYVVDADYFNES